MTDYMIQIGNEVRSMTDEERAQRDKDIAECVQLDADRKAKQQARAAVLTKLGLTADEAAALLG